MISDKGIASWVDAISGKVVWTKRVGGKFSSSPVAADGMIYMFDEAGKALVIKAADTFELVASNRLENGCMASPAISGRSLIVRTKTDLYRIETRHE